MPGKKGIDIHADGSNVKINAHFLHQGPGLFGILEETATSPAMNGCTRLTIERFMSQTEDVWPTKWLSGSARKRVTQLVLRDVRPPGFVPLVMAMGTMPNITRLCIWGVGWVQSPNLDDHVLAVMEAAPAPPSLDELTVYGVAGESLRILCTWLFSSGTVVHTLCWGAHDSDTQWFLDTLGAGVRRLTLVYCGKATPVLTDLCHFASLTILEFTVTTEPSATWEYLEWVVESLGSLPWKTPDLDLLVQIDLQRDPSPEGGGETKPRIDIDIEEGEGEEEHPALFFLDSLPEIFRDGGLRSVTLTSNDPEHLRGITLTRESGVGIDFRYLAHSASSLRQGWGEPSDFSVRDLTPGGQRTLHHYWTRRDTSNTLRLWAPDPAQ